MSFNAHRSSAFRALQASTSTMSFNMLQYTSKLSEPQMPQHIIQKWQFRHSLLCVASPAAAEPKPCTSQSRHWRRSTCCSESNKMGSAQRPAAAKAAAAAIAVGIGNVAVSGSNCCSGHSKWAVSTPGQSSSSSSGPAADTCESQCHYVYAIVGKLQAEGTFVLSSHLPEQRLPRLSMAVE